MYILVKFFALDDFNRWTFPFWTVKVLLSPLMMCMGLSVVTFKTDIISGISDIDKSCTKIYFTLDRHLLWQTLTRYHNKSVNSMWKYSRLFFRKILKTTFLIKHRVVNLNDRIKTTHKKTDRGRNVQNGEPYLLSIYFKTVRQILIWSIAIFTISPIFIADYFLNYNRQRETINSKTYNRDKSFK